MGVRRSVRHISLGTLVMGRRLTALVRRPVFWVVTIVGNSVIVLGSASLYWLEGGVNPELCSWIDAFYWGFSTVTTVGYGDIVPVTSAGKLISIVLMIVGTCCFWGYTALFASALILPDLESVETQLKKIERELEKS